MRTSKKKLKILDEGVVLAEDADSLNFEGLGVTGSVFNNEVTEDIPGGGSGGLDSFDSPVDSITIGGTLTDPTIDINLAHSNTFTANQGINYDSNVSTEVTAFEVLFNKDVAQVDTEYGFAAIYAGITDSTALSGTIEDKQVQKSAFEVGAFRSGDSTVNWIDGQESFRGYTSAVAYAGTISGAKHNAEIIGHDISVQHNTAFSNDGTHVHRIFGNKIAVIAYGTVSIDSFVTRRVYGEYIEVAIGSDADLDEAYGLYIKDVDGGDTNYAIYSETTALSHFDGDIEVPDEAYGSGWNGSLEVPTKNAIYDAFQSGTYTPTRSAEANMDANVTMTEAQYMRVGNTVTVSGRFTANPTLAATATSFEITLPIASNIGAVEDCSGVAFCSAIAGMGGAIFGVAANDTAQIGWISSDINSQSWSYTFTYQVI